MVLANIIFFHFLFILLYVEYTKYLDTLKIYYGIRNNVDLVRFLVRQAVLKVQRDRIAMNPDKDIIE